MAAVVGEWMPGGVVWVRNKLDARRLHECGYFGKGIASHFGVEAMESDPFDVLQLSAEEALYLAAATASARLTIVQTSSPGIDDIAFPIPPDAILSAERVYSLATQNDAAFSQRLSVYCYLRRRGWVVRSGLKYGVDFVVYPNSPAHEHAAFGVVIRDRKSDMGWRLIHTLTRLSTLVAKGLVLCSVRDENKIVPSSSFKDSDERVVEPSALNLAIHASVDEVHVRRWVPEKTRIESGEKLMNLE